MNLVTRAQWGARPPRNRTPLNPTGATAHWEGPHMGVFPHTACPSKVRGIQAFHMDSRGWSDIAYNAIVCPHGYVFEGRGPGGAQPRSLTRRICAPRPCSFSSMHS